MVMNHFCCCMKFTFISSHNECFRFFTMCRCRIRSRARSRCQSIVWKSEYPENPTESSSLADTPKPKLSLSSIVMCCLAFVRFIAPLSLTFEAIYFKIYATDFNNRKNIFPLRIIPTLQFTDLRYSSIHRGLKNIFRVIFGDTLRNEKSGRLYIL